MFIIEQLKIKRKIFPLIGGYRIKQLQISRWVWKIELVNFEKWTSVLQNDLLYGSKHRIIFTGFEEQINVYSYHLQAPAKKCENSIKQESKQFLS